MCHKTLSVIHILPPLYKITFTLRLKVSIVLKSDPQDSTVNVRGTNNDIVQGDCCDEMQAKSSSFSSVVKTMYICQ